LAGCWRPGAATAAPDTGTGQVLRGRISPTCRDTLRVRLEQSAARGDATLAVAGLHRAAVHHQRAAVHLELPIIHRFERLA
jgi:hypothetical protein